MTMTVHDARENTARAIDRKQPRHRLTLAWINLRIWSASKLGCESISLFPPFMKWGQKKGEAITLNLEDRGFRVRAYTDGEYTISWRAKS